MSDVLHSAKSIVSSSEALDYRKLGTEGKIEIVCERPSGYADTLPCQKPLSKGWSSRTGLRFRVEHKGTLPRTENESTLAFVYIRKSSPWSGLQIRQKQQGSTGRSITEKTLSTDTPDQYVLYTEPTKPLTEGRYTQPEDPYLE